METMTVTNEKTLQQGLNDVVINKVQRMIDGKSVGVQGGSTLWKLTQAITAHARELTPERSRELHEISGSLLNRVKLQA